MWLGRGEWGRWGLAPMGFLSHIPTRQAQESPACTVLFKGPQILERVSGCWRPSLQRGGNLIHRPQLLGFLQENEIPGRGPKGAQASSSGFHGAICGAGDREPSAGHSCPFPACLVGLPHQETHVSMSAPQSPHEASSPLGGQATTATRWTLVPLALCRAWGAMAQPGREAGTGAGSSASTRCLPLGGRQ